MKIELNYKTFIQENSFEKSAKWRIFCPAGDELISLPGNTASDNEMHQ